MQQNRECITAILCCECAFGQLLQTFVMCDPPEQLDPGGMVTGRMFNCTNRPSAVTG
jgi:hypothetical protein